MKSLSRAMASRTLMERLTLNSASICILPRQEASDCDKQMADRGRREEKEAMEHVEIFFAMIRAPQAFASKPQNTSPRNITTSTVNAPEVPGAFIIAPNHINFVAGFSATSPAIARAADTGRTDVSSY
jgi:hypothetical protein